MKRIIGGSLNLILVNSKSLTTNRHYSACTVCRNYIFTKRIPALTQNIQNSDHRSIHLSSSCLRKDYYGVLGVSKSATAKDIKKAYYELAKKYHPDTNKNDPNSHKKFHDVAEAYEVLSDETKRKEYDMFGTTSGQSSGQSTGYQGGFGPQGFSQHWQYKSTIDPEELFRKIFGDFKGGMGGGGMGGMGFDDFSESKFGFGSAQEVIMNLTFSQAARGVNKDINVNVVDTCVKCNGSRCEPGTKPGKCMYCNGTGVETISTGPFVMRSTCRYCQGTRMYIKYPCTECDGKGQTVQRKQVNVQVPPGVSTGQTVRMTVGNQELFITFKVETSRYFKRDGDDVHTDAEISLSQAILGGTIRIQGVYEDQTIQIMAGTSSHHTVHLKGKGIKRANRTGTGDHYVHLKIVIPKKLTDKQKALIQAYAELEKDTPGQIYGITYKSDGKSENTSSETISEKFTQGKNSVKEEEDDPNPEEVKRKKSEYKYFFLLGLISIYIITVLVMREKQDEDLVNKYRDLTFEKQRARSENN
ncbi:protein tumorous imaginal discs, mitochondrial-like isoform X1 [Chironomus tepperi]|uniref:protein tumorous imaginal discs, mitochondrial-like isoform X1 n=1 Tax=Chironomus tepperi TaxID=113505 RepID=UPI00391F8C33